MTQKNLNTSLEKILLTVLIHEKQHWFTLKKRINIEQINHKKLNIYKPIFSDIDYFFKKIIKYKVYFEEFYPKINKISNREALEYHIYSYLQDITIFRNKLIVFFNTFKKDLTKKYLNKDEIENHFTKLKNKIHKIFENTIEKYRNPHHHHGYRFINGDLVDSRMYSRMLDENFLLKQKINTDIINTIKNKEIAHFEKAKNDYITIAKKNNNQIIGLINTLFKEHELNIYKILGINPIDQNF